MKRILFLIACIFITSLLIANDVTVHFIDVGQGDCTFIDYGDFEILIDAGNNHYGEDVYKYIQDYVFGSLDIVVATHPDADHIGGLDVILQKFPVTTIIDSGKSHTTKTYKDYMNAVFNELGTVFIYDSDMQFKLGEGVVFEVIEIIDDSKDNNENSVVTALHVNDISFLFTGDLEKQLEIKYLDLFFSIDVLKVGHHGSKTSTSNEFLNKIQPKYAVISCGENNRYGHPHQEVLERLENYGVKTFRTDISGSIVITISENTLTVNE